MSSHKRIDRTPTPAINRRRVLAFGLGAAGALTAAAKAYAQTHAPPNPFPPPSRPYAPPRVAQPRIDPILFWNEVSLQLVALDHSIDAKDARAPGPCATARALGLVHIVMADAVAAVFPAGFEGLYVRGVPIPDYGYPEVFVGAAAARMLEHIYSTPAHTQFIGSQRLHFLKHFDQGALTAWNAGLAFGRNELFASRWNWQEIKSAALSSAERAHSLRRGEHDVDPFNPDQKFYGVKWGRMTPLMPGLPVASLGPGDPPREYDREYQRDLEEVKELGVFHPDGPTAEQIKIGLFWAYDGARLIGTPPRLYNQFVRQIAESDGLPVPEMARLFALCNVALADAGIVAWEAKYRYQLWRPVIGIPEARIDPVPDWRPFGSPRTNPAQFSLGSDTQFRLTAQSMLGAGDYTAPAQPAKNALAYHRASFTPNFPSYPSGHAAFGSACFNMLKWVRAENEATRRDPGRIEGGQAFVSDELNGVSIDNFKNEPRPYLPIHYTRIEKMIEDNNKSRVHLGVHWSFDCELGERSGARIAEAIHRNAYRRIR
jgi:hypothetical protein